MEQLRQLVVQTWDIVNAAKLTDSRGLGKQRWRYTATGQILDGSRQIAAYQLTAQASRTTHSRNSTTIPTRTRLSSTSNSRTVLFKEFHRPHVRLFYKTVKDDKFAPLRTHLHKYPWHILNILKKTRGQSNLTKSASRGAHSPVRGHPRGSKVVPLNSWGRVFY